MSWDQVPDHTGRALLNMAGPMQTPSLQLLLIPLGEMLQDLETLFFEILAARVIGSATGNSLAILGSMVGEPVLGDADATYRIRISLKLRAIYSTKDHESFRTLLRLLVGMTWGLQEAAGWVDVTQTSGTLGIAAGALLRFLKIASADGVIVRLASLEEGDANPAFEWRSADGAIVGSTWRSADGAIAGVGWLGVRML